MKTKSLWRIFVTTTREAEDAVAELLGATLGQPVSSHFHVETGVSTVIVYGQRKLISSHDVREKIRAGLKRIKNCGLKIGSGKIIVAKVRREDWATSWKRHFKPIEIGDALLIKPSWSKRKPRKNQAVVVLDPGLSFGTGQHPTTMFCLGELVRLKNRERARLGRSSTRPASSFRTGGRGVRQNTRGRVCSPSFLDLGAGSGILAIAAAKLGCQPVYAIDFDPEAVRVARANARANRVHNKLRIARGDVAKLPFRTRRRYDLICANLISDLLIAERRRIAAQLNHRGTLVLAGILKREFAQVRRAFEELDLKLVSSECRGEWRSGSFCFVREKSF
jgi:ribosomal protein L11 methyltransferase